MARPSRPPIVSVHRTDIHRAVYVHWLPSSPVDVRQGVLTSNSMPYTYLQPAPFITVLEPASGPTGQTIPFKIKGGNFTTNCIVYFDGAVLANTFVSAAQLDCVAPAKSVADNCNVTVVDGALQFQHRDLQLSAEDHVAARDRAEHRGQHGGADADRLYRRPASNPIISLSWGQWRRGR